MAAGLMLQATGCLVLMNGVVQKFEIEKFIKK
jgi:hypothetical protein